VDITVPNKDNGYLKKKKNDNGYLFLLNYPTIAKNVKREKRNKKNIYAATALHRKITAKK